MMGAVTYTSPCLVWGDGKQNDHKLLRAAEVCFRPRSWESGFRPTSGRSRRPTDLLRVNLPSSAEGPDVLWPMLENVSMRFRALTPGCPAWKPGIALENDCEQETTGFRPL